MLLPIGGYTPGDTWTLYVGSDGRVEEFRFDHGGDKKPSVVIATWAGYKKAGPLLISTEHRGTADGKPFHLWFTNVAVKLVEVRHLDGGKITGSTTQCSEGLVGETLLSLAITTVVHELLTLGRSRLAAMRTSRRCRSPRTIGQ